MSDLKILPLDDSLAMGRYIDDAQEASAHVYDALKVMGGDFVQQFIPYGPAPTYSAVLLWAELAPLIERFFARNRGLE